MGACRGSQGMHKSQGDLELQMLQVDLLLRTVNLTAFVITSAFLDRLIKQNRPKLKDKDPSLESNSTHLSITLQVACENLPLLHVYVTSKILFKMI